MRWGVGCRKGGSPYPAASRPAFRPGHLLPAAPGLARKPQTGLPPRLSRVRGCARLQHLVQVSPHGPLLVMAVGVCGGQCERRGAPGRLTHAPNGRHADWPSRFTPSEWCMVRGGRGARLLCVFACHGSRRRPEAEAGWCRCGGSTPGRRVFRLIGHRRGAGQAVGAAWARASWVQPTRPCCR